VDHQAPAGLLFPLPVPTRWGGCISLDFLELPAARSGHDFLQLHIDLLTGRVLLVPTFKTATSQTGARNFVASVFRNVGLPDVLVSDRDTRFTSAFWTGLHAALGALLMFGSPHHHNTTSKVERINAVIADVLRSVRSFAGERADEWPDFVPLVEFAAVRHQRLRVAAWLRQSAPPSPPRPAGGAGLSRPRLGHCGPDGARHDRRGAGAAAGAAGPAQGGARRAPAGRALRSG
jgi:hypothetical protein